MLTTNEEKEKIADGYQKFEFEILGFNIVAFFNPCFCENVPHYEFYGNATSETGYRSFFMEMGQKVDDPLSTAKEIAEHLIKEQAPSKVFAPEVKSAQLSLI
jgi:hypothetical protein